MFRPDTGVPPELPGSPTLSPSDCPGSPARSPSESPGSLALSPSECLASPARSPSEGPANSGSPTGFQHISDQLTGAESRELGFPDQTSSTCPLIGDNRSHLPVSSVSGALTPSVVGDLLESNVTGCHPVLGSDPVSSASTNQSGSDSSQGHDSSVRKKISDQGHASSVREQNSNVNSAPAPPSPLQVSPAHA